MIPAHATFQVIDDLLPIAIINVGKLKDVESAKSDIDDPGETNPGRIDFAQRLQCLRSPLALRGV